MVYHFSPKLLVPLHSQAPARFSRSQAGAWERGGTSAWEREQRKLYSLSAWRTNGTNKKQLPALSGKRRIK